MTSRLLSYLIAMSLATAACGSDAESSPDGPDMPDVPDAPAPRAAANANKAVSTAAGRMTGGTWTLDVQLGAPFEQRRIQRDGRTAASGAPHLP